MSGRHLIQNWFITRYRWFAYAGICFLLLFVVNSNYLVIIERIDALVGPHPQLSWPTVQGAVRAVELRCTRRLVGDNDLVFEVHFVYHVEGSDYSHKQRLYWALILPAGDPETLWFGLSCGGPIDDSREAHLRLLAAVRDRLEYQEGRQVTVYYNPKKPSEGVIMPGLVLGSTQSYGELIDSCTALILLVGGIGSFMAGMQGLRKWRFSKYSLKRPPHKARITGEGSVAEEFRSRQVDDHHIAYLEPSSSGIHDKSNGDTP